VTRRVPRTIILALVVFGLAIADGILLYKRSQYRDETARLRADMSTLERDRADAIVAGEANRTGLILQLVRRQALGDDALHLAVNTDSSFVALDRGSVRLRVMPAQFGKEQRVGVPPDTVWVAVPRGMRTVERVLGKADRFELPAWVWGDRGLPVPGERAGPAWIGANAIVVAGGTVLYSTPADGPLADSSYVMPGAVRLSASDLAAVRENITSGMRIYFF
jgi:hypothetical protein